MGATESDFMALQSVRLSTRVEVMYVYLCDKHCYSMQELSLIHIFVVPRRCC